MNLQGFPVLDFIVELVFCIACWKIFGGSKGLLIGIVVFNVIDLPLMFPRPGSLTPMIEHPAILPTVILIQVVTTWLVVGLLGPRTIYLAKPLRGAPT